MQLLSDTERLHLHSYRYSGGDSSPVYKYVLSPFAKFCVYSFVPTWLAPNVVTLLGLLASVVAVVCTLLLNPELNSEGPRWLHLLTGICILSYQTLDNMDGVQARRTNSSSPLGMLFDHTCDTINAGLMSIAIASSLATGWTVRIYFCLLSGFFPFYFQAWEEYYIGTMVLPPFNGPSEGLLIAAIICMISSYKGAHWCHEVKNKSCHTVLCCFLLHHTRVMMILNPPI